MFLSVGETVNILILSVSFTALSPLHNLFLTTLSHSFNLHVSISLLNVMLWLVSSVDLWVTNNKKSRYLLISNSSLFKHSRVSLNAPWSSHGGSFCCGRKETQFSLCFKIKFHWARPLVVSPDHTPPPPPGSWSPVPSPRHDLDTQCPLSNKRCYSEACFNVIGNYWLTLRWHNNAPHIWYYPI